LKKNFKKSDKIFEKWFSGSVETKRNQLKEPTQRTNSKNQLKEPTQRTNSKNQLKEPTQRTNSKIVAKTTTKP
jgi:hypothetical protein